MAKVIYKPGVEPLSGIYCGVEYRKNPNGGHSAFLQPLPTPKQVRKNPAARADFIIKTCVCEIQRAMNDRYEATRQYSAITKRVKRLYGKLYNLEKDNSKLIKAILDGYWQSRRILPSRKIDHPQLALDG